MAGSDALQNQIAELAAAVFDGSVDQSQFEHLTSLLEQYPEARKIYAELVGLHVSLHDVYGAQTISPIGNSASSIGNSTGGGTSFDIGDALSPPTATSSFPRGLFMIALPGAVVLTMVLAITFGWLDLGHNRAIARVVRQSLDAHWYDANGRQIATPKVESLGWCKLKRGMIKIEFRHGATVILEGPTQFRVLDGNSLQLQSGKLSASVPESAHGFTVLAPNVKVVDLGTEFGIDASRLDETFVQVTRGRVAVTTFDATGTEKSQRDLVEKECLTISRIGAVEEIRFGSVKLPMELSDASVDLVDVVCGGSGTEQRRGCGIDCMTGKWKQLTTPFTGKLPVQPVTIGSGKYFPVPELPFVDGVFVPNSGKTPMRVDSAGHQFFGFGKTSGQNYDLLMAGAAVEFFQTPRYQEQLKIGDIDYTTSPHGLLVLRGNKGITFDLEAIRKAYPDMQITRFRSLAANTENSGVLKLLGGPFRADLWVLVDGVAVYARTGLATADGTLDIDIPISPNARFLTLAATEGSEFSLHDWIVFANPTLELMKKD